MWFRSGKTEIQDSDSPVFSLSVHKPSFGVPEGKANGTGEAEEDEGQRGNSWTDNDTAVCVGRDEAGVMPTRILREGIITSESVNSLGWAAEVFYRRLHSVVDDYGRFSAHPSLLRAACYPLRLNDVSDRDVVKWLAECAAKALVKVYEVEGKQYLEVTKFEQRVRAEKSKCPQPPPNDGQMTVNCQTTAHVVEGVDVDEVVVPVGNAPKNGARHVHVDDSPVLITLPLRDGSKYEVRKSLVTELEPLYPNVDIPRTLPEMKGWLLTNPDRLKTRRGALKFIGSWLQREEEKHGG